MNKILSECILYYSNSYFNYIMSGKRRFRAFGVLSLTRYAMPRWGTYLLYMCCVYRHNNNWHRSCYKFIGQETGMATQVEASMIGLASRN